MTPADSAPPAGSSTRLVSLDALRGFDMFWILGADEFVRAFDGMEKSTTHSFLGTQLEHVAWSGLTFYDLIFPLFIFIVGVSLAFSLDRQIARHGRGTAVKHILVRTALLIVFGIFYNGGLTHEWPQVRLVGVLQRIAVCYAAVALLYCFCRPRTLGIVGGVLLIGYWALLTFVPIRNVVLDVDALEARLGHSAERIGRMPSPAFDAETRALYESTTERVTGAYDEGLNLANHIDFNLLPGVRYFGFWDPEGLLSTLPAVTTCIIGVFAGLLLRRRELEDRRRLLWLVGAGLGALALGYLWGLQFPIVKKIWTSSFVLVTGGWSLLLLALFHYLVDVRGWQKWCQPFVWIGMNPITLYLATSAVNFGGIARRFVGGSVEEFFDVHVDEGSGTMVIALTTMLLLILLARFMYRRGIFLRV